jgi:hypothetical protein
MTMMTAAENATVVTAIMITDHHHERALCGNLVLYNRFSFQIAEVFHFAIKLMVAMP